jgi:hypothetical protein
MTEETARWRGSVCILLLFFIVAFFIEGRELLIFTRTFIEVHTTWRPVQGLVQENLIATSERRSSSTRSSAVAHITLFTVGAKVRYTLNDKRMASQLLDGESTSGGFRNGSSPELKLGGPFPSECARARSIMRRCLTTGTPHPLWCSGASSQRR